MLEGSPNQEEIDWLVERIRDLYNYERLKECDIDYLHNLEFAVKSKIKIFEAGHPDNQKMDRASRAVMADVPPEQLKKPLTDHERMRLQLLWEEARLEIHRAYGHRLELRREHRSRIANAIADMCGNARSRLSRGD